MQHSGVLHFAKEHAGKKRSTEKCKFGGGRRRKQRSEEGVSKQQETFIFLSKRIFIFTFKDAHTYGEKHETNKHSSSFTFTKHQFYFFFVSLSPPFIVLLVEGQTSSTKNTKNIYVHLSIPCRQPSMTIQYFLLKPPY